MHRKNTKALKSLYTFILICVISFSIPITVAYAAGHTSHYALNPLVSMGSTRTNVHWWYSQEGSRFYGYRITRGANAWEDASGLDAGFTEVSTKSDAEIRVYSDDYGNTNWIGYHTPLIGYGNIKLNEYYHDSNGGYTRYEEVFAHEMGHAFGLSHYDCDNELMQAKGYIYTPDPQEGDIGARGNLPVRRQALGRAHTPARVYKCALSS